ncbi:Hypothetical protein D9617_13g099830 [Elsinoe fawcettii]|nr:Hypothetical protein D9617_13g099830 [Elsinoe fawcettii]
MPSLDATLACQFDKATLGLTVAVMRDQILANIIPMFPSRPSLHHLPGIHTDHPTYDVILSEHGLPTIPLLQYQAAVICTDNEGMRIVLHGKKEATVWAAYRSLMRITMKEVGKRLSMPTTSAVPGHEVNSLRGSIVVGIEKGVSGGEIKGHKRVESGDSGVAGLRTPTGEGEMGEIVMMMDYMGGARDSCAGAEREGKGAKSLRVLGLEGME